jgi:hypothetical protein
MDYELPGSRARRDPIPSTLVELAPALPVQGEEWQAEVVASAGS